MIKEYKPDTLIVINDYDILYCLVKKAFIYENVVKEYFLDLHFIKTSFEEYFLENYFVVSEDITYFEYVPSIKISKTYFNFEPNIEDFLDKDSHQKTHKIYEQFTLAQSLKFKLENYFTNIYENFHDIEKATTTANLMPFTDEDFTNAINKIYQK